MLIGISDAVTVLARSSTSRMKPDPNNIDIGMEVSWLTPAVRRAMWGMTSPTQETVPDTLTQQEVMRVATTIRTGRNSLTFTPREVASSSPNERTFRRHEVRIRNTIQGTSRKRSVRTMSHDALWNPPIIQKTIAGNCS